MAVQIASASSARVEYNTVPGVGGLTEISIAVTLKCSNPLAGGSRILSEWSSSAAGQSFLLYTADSSQVAAIIYYNNGWYSFKTTSNPVTSGALLRILMRAHLSPAPQSMDIWINGVSQPLMDIGYQGGNVTQVNAGGQAFDVGMEVAENLVGVEGVYSEVAIWGAKVPDWVARAYGLGVSPKVWRKNGLFYAPLYGAYRVSDEWGGLAGSSTVGVTDAPHSCILRPGRPRVAV